jgi:cytochrome c oxidase assembly protein subunit 15
MPLPMIPTPDAARMAQRYARPTPPALRRFAKFTAASTLFLIFAGAMVTSTGSGLAVPDWPLSYGMLMPPMVGGIFYEHGHRVIAATVGLLTVLQAIWLQLREPKRFVRMLGWAAVGAVIAQGVLGGLTVIFLLPPAISIAHAGLAEIFFCLNVSIAFFTSLFFGELRATERGDAPVAGSTAVVFIVYLQILAGALMRHLGAGLAIPDFPLSFGRLVPRFTSAAIAVNFGHRIGALLVTAAVIAIFVRLRRFDPRHPLRRVSRLLVLVVPAQLMLGACTVWSGKQPVITSLHVVTGALTLALALILALTARAVAWREQRHTPGKLVAVTA